MTRGNVPVPSRAEVLRSSVGEVKPELSPGERVLLDEACRIVDRLDRFDALLTGDLDTWLTVKVPRGEGDIVLEVSSVLTEARQYAAELRQLVKQLDLPASAASAPVESKLGKLLAIKGTG